MAYTTTIQDKKGDRRTIKDPEALRANSNASNGSFDAAYIGSGIGTCSTAATTAAKVATLANYLLLKNMSVSVIFVNGINVASATLNINSQGAKPLMLDGNTLPPGVVKARTTVTMVYDGTNYQIIGMTSAVSTDDELLVDMGLPSGRLWATRNIDVTQANGFAASPFQYECSFVSWGNTDMHNPVTNSSFGDWSFGSANDTEPYASSPGATIDFSTAQEAGEGFDAAVVNLGKPWRMPKTAEFAELFNSSYTKYIDANGETVTTANNVTKNATDYPNDKRVEVNGVVGLYLESLTNGKRIFFPCAGGGNGTSRYNRGSDGLYWSSSLHSAANGRNLGFGSGGVYPQGYNNRFYGFAVRPVQ